MPEWLQFPLIIGGGILAGICIHSPALSQVLAVAYGIIALIWRIPSRITFLLAALAMTTTTLFLVGKGDVAFAQNFATITFLLLVAGVFGLGRELKKEGGRIYNSRKNTH